MAERPDIILEAEKRDLLRRRLQILKVQHRENPERYFRVTYPVIKMLAIYNFHNELQHAKTDAKFTKSREKRFQILHALLDSPELSSKIISECTSAKLASGFQMEQTSNWIEHPPLDVYFKNPENKVDKNYNGKSLIQFLRFIRNTQEHILQSAANFRAQILGRERLSRADFCDFFDKRYPDLLAFLTWLYVCACDRNDEIFDLMSNESEPNDRLDLNLLIKTDLIALLFEMINFFFGENSISKEEVETIVNSLLEFGEHGFERVIKETTGKKLKEITNVKENKENFN